MKEEVRERLEWYDGGDGVEYEVYQDPVTKKLYKVEIEIVRNFEEAEEVFSLKEWADKLYNNGNCTKEWRDRFINQLNK